MLLFGRSLFRPEVVCEALTSRHVRRTKLKDKIIRNTDFGMRDKYMLTDFNAWRELGMSPTSQGAGPSSPAEIAVSAAIHENQELCKQWFEMTSNLAEVNPGLLRRVAGQIRFSRPESPTHRQVADTIEQMLMA